MKISHSILLLLLASFSAFSVGGCRSNGEPDAMSEEDQLLLYYERALRYFEMRELDRCQGQVQKGLEIDPDNEKLLFMLGRCHQTRGTLNDILAAESIFRDHPAKGDFRIHVCLGGTLERKGSYYYDASKRVASGDQLTDAPDPVARAAELNETALECWKESYKEFEEALRLFPGGFEAYNGLMRVSVFLKDYAQSYAWSEEFLGAIAQSNEVFRRKLEEQEASGSATVDTEFTLLNNGDLAVQVHLHRAEILHQQKNLKDSLRELDEALTIDDKLPEIHALRGQLLRKLGDYQRSNDSLERYVSLSNDPFDHPNIRQAFDWIQANKAALRAKLR